MAITALDYLKANPESVVVKGSITGLLMNCAALLRKKFKESEKSSGHCI